MDILPPGCEHHPTDYCAHPDRGSPLIVMSEGPLKCWEARKAGKCPLGYKYPFVRE